MKFEFGGKNYEIEFRRVYREYPHTDPETKLQFMRKSTYPYTTANVIEIDPKNPLNKKVFRTATVGCHKGDRFSLEKGRTRALRLLTITTPKAMKPVLWKAYHERTRTQTSAAPEPQEI